jgi:hypothetical protein
MTSSQGLLRKLDGLRGSLEKAKERGVKIKIAAPLDDTTRKSLGNFKGMADIRHTTTNARFVIVDGKELTFMVTDDKEVHPTYDIGIWVRTPLFASALQNMFDMAWPDMKPLK